MELTKERYLEDKKHFDVLVKRLYKCGLDINIIEVPTANHGPDIQFRIFYKGKYLTDACDMWDLEYLAIVLEAMQ